MTMMTNFLYVSDGEWFQSLYYILHEMIAYQGIHWEGIIFKQGLIC